MKKEQLERIRQKLGEIEAIIKEDTAGADTIILSFNGFKGVVTTELKEILWGEYEDKTTPAPATPP